MKLILPAAALLALAACTSKPDNGYTVNTNIGLPDGAKLTMSYQIGDSTVIDSANVINGKAQFTGTIENVKVASISYMADEEKGRLAHFPIYLEPGEITVTIADPMKYYEDMTIVGGKTQQEADELVKLTSEIEEKMSAVYKHIPEGERIAPDSPERAKLDSLRNVEVEVMTEWVRQHPESYHSLTVLDRQGHMFDPETKMELFNGLSAYLQAEKPELKTHIQAEINIMPGKPAPEIIGTDPMTGKEIKLNEMKGNPVLIDFWATWCGPCRASLPHVMELNEKYAKKGLQVLLVSCDRNVNAWKNYIKEHGLDKAINVHEYSVIPTNEDGDVVAGEGNVSQADGYGVVGIPAKFLIDRDGKMIGQFHIDEQLDAELEKLFK